MEIKIMVTLILIRRNKGHSSRKAPNNNENFESCSITKIRRKTSKL